MFKCIILVFKYIPIFKDANREFVVKKIQNLHECLWKKTW